MIIIILNRVQCSKEALYLYTFDLQVFTELYLINLYLRTVISVSKIYFYDFAMYRNLEQMELKIKKKINTSGQLCSFIRFSN